MFLLSLILLLLFVVLCVASLSSLTLFSSQCKNHSSSLPSLVSRQRRLHRYHGLNPPVWPQPTVCRRKTSSSLCTVGICFPRRSQGAGTNVTHVEKQSKTRTQHETIMLLYSRMKTMSGNNETWTKRNRTNTRKPWREYIKHSTYKR